MKTTFKFAAIAVATALTACGGGGGGGSAAPAATAPATPVAPVVVAASLVTSVPAANYTGDAATAFALLNAERNTCGFGLLAQNAALDAAATAHAGWAKLNGIVSHTEAVGQVGFTGVNPTDRAVVKGYVGSAGEVMAAGNGQNAIRDLLSAPYHLRGLMDGYRDVGLGIVESNVPNYPYFVGDLGVQTAAGGNQLLASTDVLTYPCAGTIGVNFQLRGESPNPIPGRDLSTNPIGTPLFIKVRDGNTLIISSASLIKASTGTVISLRTPVTASNDPNKVNGVSYFRASEAYIAPDVPLEKGTQYQATVTGTNNGTAFSRTFSFTTGNGVN